MYISANTRTTLFYQRKCNIYQNHPSTAQSAMKYPRRSKFYNNDDETYWIGKRGHAV